MESCSTPFSESSETLNVNPNVDNILNEITLRPSHSLIKFTPPSKNTMHRDLDDAAFPRIFVPPLLLTTTENGRMSTDMQ
jgi:hypothetical protein